MDSGAKTRARAKADTPRGCSRAGGICTGYLFEHGKGNLGCIHVRAGMFRDGKKSDTGFADDHLAALDAGSERIRNRKLRGRLHPVTSDGRKPLERLSQSICLRLLFGQPWTEKLCMSIPEIGFNQAVVHVLLFLQHSDATARELRQVRG